MVEKLHIGTRGEAIFTVLMTKFCGDLDYPLFSVHYLGERHETFDYFIKLLERGNATPYFFFVQVKATRQGYTSGNRLAIRVSKNDMALLRAYPAPTYIVGVNLENERGYILSANEDSPTQLRSIPTRHVLDCNNLEILWTEVQTFWGARDMRLTGSQFV